MTFTCNGVEKGEKIKPFRIVVSLSEEERISLSIFASVLFDMMLIPV